MTQDHNQIRLFASEFNESALEDHLTHKKVSTESMNKDTAQSELFLC